MRIDNGKSMILLIGAFLAGAAMPGLAEETAVAAAGEPVVVTSQPAAPVAKSTVQKNAVSAKPQPAVRGKRRFPLILGFDR